MEPEELKPDQRLVKASPGRVKAAKRSELRRQALELRVAGAAYETIAMMLGVSKVTAWRYVDSALKESAQRTGEAADKLRAIELRRTEAVIRALWPRRAEPRTANAIERQMDHRAKLLGLYAPAKVEHAGPEGQPIGHVVMTAAEAAAIVLRARRAAERMERAGLVVVDGGAPEVPSTRASTDLASQLAGGAVSFSKREILQPGPGSK